MIIRSVLLNLRNLYLNLLLYKINNLYSKGIYCLSISHSLYQIERDLVSETTNVNDKILNTQINPRRNNYSKKKTSGYFPVPHSLKEKVEYNSGVKTLSGDKPEIFSNSFFVSPLKVPLNCDVLSKENENKISDFSPEIYFFLHLLKLITKMDLFYRYGIYH